MSESELKPRVKLSSLDLSHLDFSDVDLTDAELMGCALYEAQVQGAILQGARFEDCRFVRCRFAHVDLREAVFQGCSFADEGGHAGPQFAFSRLDEARFAKCDLSFARFERSSLYGVEMETCNMRGAAFVHADFARTFGRNVVRCSARLAGCNLELADLTQRGSPTAISIDRASGRRCWSMRISKAPICGSATSSRR